MLTLFYADRIAAQNVTPCSPAWNQFSGSDRISSTIYASIRGNDDLIYLGGRDGIYRIEGGDVHRWFPDFTTPRALPSGNVKAFALQGDYIWVGSNSGISRLNTRNGQFERNERLNQQTGFTSVNGLAVKDQYLYVATTAGGYKVELNDNINDLSIVQQFSDTEALNKIQLIEAMVVAVGQTGLWRLDNQTPQQLALDGINLVDIEHTDNTVWLVSPDTLYSSDSSLKNWSTHTRETLQELPESAFTALTTDMQGNLWIGARRGISRWDVDAAHPTSCRRAVTGSNRDQDISISHQGSETAKSLIGLIGSALVTLPDTFLDLFREFISEVGSNYLTDRMRPFLEDYGPNSVEVLRPGHPLMDRLYQLPVKGEAFSVIGSNSITECHSEAECSEITDGVVDYPSAFLRDAKRTIIVDSSHNSFRSAKAIDFIVDELKKHKAVAGQCGT